MRLVVDTNVLISALLSATSLPARLMTFWREGRFVLVTSAVQVDEMMRVTRYPKLRERLSPALAGRLINELRDLAVVVSDLPEVSLSPDPDDDFLLASSLAGAAQFLITGDKADLLALESFKGVQIRTVRAFLALQGW